MKTVSYFVSALLAAVAVANPTPTLEKRDTTMCGTWGTVATGGYTVYHNTWGSGKATSGSQCTTFTSFSSNSFVWSTTWSWAGGPIDVKSYSNVALEKVNKKLSDISSIPSTWVWR
jgi:xyloglucan-specific endo-beta-1,4-glucanase